MSRAYRQQYGCNFITAIPNNLYGENDNFDLENSHVIPAIIRKVWEAKLNNKPYIECWGDGSPLREFTYSEDIAKILLFLLENYDDPEPINIGNTDEYSIMQVAEMICSILEYNGKIRWNTKKPSGQYRKPSSNQKLLNLGWKKEWYTNLEKVVGLKRRTSTICTERVNKIYDHKNFELRYFELNDSGCMYQLLSEYRPDEIYNLAAQSHVRVSFEVPESTTDTIVMGTLRLLEAMRLIVPNARFYQASSSEICLRQSFCTSPCKEL